jgi:Zn-dependent M28 family amino/carboxypeptidase
VRTGRKQAQTAFTAAGVLLALLSATACDPGRPAAATRPSVDLAVLQKDLVARLSAAVHSTAESKLAARSYLAALWKSLGFEVLKQDYSGEGENIYTVVKAAAPAGETVVVGAHYDSARNSPGANDNATGVALVTAAAVEIARTPMRARDFIFVLFDEEERGLRGSRAFAQKIKDDGLRVHSVHTADQVGWDKDRDRAVELEIPYDGALALYGAAAKAVSPPLPLLITKESGSDHSAFRRLGFPAVGITEEYRNKDTTPHIHRPTDTVETVDFPYLASTTALVVRVLKALAR